MFDSEGQKGFSLSSFVNYAAFSLLARPGQWNLGKNLPLQSACSLSLSFSYLKEKKR